jgi:hypothetical protein
MEIAAPPSPSAAAFSQLLKRSLARPPIAFDPSQRDQVRKLAELTAADLHMALQRFRIGMDRHDGHPRCVFVDVEEPYMIS